MVAQTSEKRLAGLQASMLESLECQKKLKLMRHVQTHRIDLGKVAVLQQIVNGVKDVHFHSMGCHKLFISHGPHIVLCLTQLELHQKEYQCAARVNSDRI